MNMLRRIFSVGKDNRASIESVRKNILAGQIYVAFKENAVIGDIKVPHGSDTRWITIAEGWEIMLLDTRKDSNLFIAKAKKNARLPRHAHPQKESLRVLEGEMIENELQLVLQSNHFMVVPPMQMHEFVALEDTVLLVRFEPPFGLRICEDCGGNCPFRGSKKETCKLLFQE